MKATKLVLVGFMLAIAYTCTTIAVIPQIQVHAFPCSGGSGKEYCSGYHKGAVQADKDFANPGSGSGGIFDSTCPSGHTQAYCDGWNKGYDKESQILD